jgi:hypothetical protein
VVAADGSKMRMFLQDVTRRAVRDVVAFALYLPGLEMTLSFQLYSAKEAERQMLFEHLDQLEADDLLVLDRGYPARWLIAYLVQHGIRFCMRVDETGFAAVKPFLRSGLNEQQIIVGKPKTRDCEDYGCESRLSEVRLVKVVTPNDRIHVMMTSLLNAAAYPAGDFAALYHRRWRIEIDQPCCLHKSVFRKLLYWFRNRFDPGTFYSPQFA